MHQGRSLNEVAQELTRRQTARKDYRADNPHMRMILGDSEHASAPRFALTTKVGEQDFAMRPRFHQQLAGSLKIPKQYYDRMLTEQPALLAQNVNTWFNATPDGRHLVRTLDGSARAFLSPRYRILDAHLVAEAALPVLFDTDGIEVRSCEMTEENFYLQAVWPRLEGEIRQGEVVQAGVTISTNEVGAGAVKIEPLVFVLACLNGMITSRSLKRHHVGRPLLDVEGGSAVEIFADDTRRSADITFAKQIRDVVKNAFDEAAFRGSILSLQAAADDPLSTTGDYVAAVGAVAEEVNLTQGEQHGVLQRLMEGRDYTRWGMSNAITAEANDTESYDRAVELERIGGQVIIMPPNTWGRVQEATVTAA